MKRMALLVQDLDSDYFSTMVEGAKRYCDEHGHKLIVYIVRAKNWTHGSFDYQPCATVKLVTEGNVDGILLATNTWCQNVEEEKREALVKEMSFLPLVSIGARIPGVSSVVSASKKAFKALLAHLADVHHRKNIILMVPVSTSVDIIARRESYIEFLAERGIPLDSSKIIEADYTFERAREKVSHLCPTKSDVYFDAIATCSDDLAFGCISALHEIGVRIPEDVAVTGFDNQHRCNYSAPCLTSIDQNMSQQGYEAARLLDLKLTNPSAPFEHTAVLSEAVYRNSCGCTSYKIERRHFNEEVLLLTRKEILSHFHFFLQEMQASLSLDEFKTLIIRNLREYEIKNCVICLYDDPVYYERNGDFALPDSARVLLAYNEKGVCSKLEYSTLNPAENMIPENFSFPSDSLIVVTALFNTSYQYGYALYTPGSVEPRMYELLFSATGIALASNRALSLKDAETRRLEIENQDLELMSMTDSLTGVLNRGGFMKEARALIEKSLKDGLNGAVIYGDMDGLKLINDNFGHDAGDLAIKAEVEIFKKVFRESDVIGRLGGDEFAFVISAFDEEDFRKLVSKMDEESRHFNEKSSFLFSISISLGVSFFSKTESDLDLLLKKADENQYEAKRIHHQNS